MSKDNVLVTGSTGFIGSYLSDCLAEQMNTNVICLGRNSINILTNPLCKYVKGDICDFHILENLFQEYEIRKVYHLAGSASVPLSNEYPTIDYENNVLGTYNILNLAVKFKIDKFVFSSSAAVYGNPIYTPIDEGHPLNPISNYGVNKLYGEKLGLCYSNIYDLPFTSVRIFTTYGPKQTRLVIYDLIKKLSRNKEELEVLGTGEEIRDYCYIKDTINALMLIMESDKSIGNVYNLAGGKPIRIKDLVKKIVQILKVDPKINYTSESWKGDVSNFTSDISKIKETFGFQPVYGLDYGLKETIKWFNENELRKQNTGDASSCINVL